MTTISASSPGVERDGPRLVPVPRTGIAPVAVDDEDEGARSEVVAGRDSRVDQVCAGERPGQVLHAEGRAQDEEEHEREPDGRHQRIRPPPDHGRGGQPAHEQDPEAAGPREPGGHARQVRPGEELREPPLPERAAVVLEDLSPKRLPAADEHRQPQQQEHDRAAARRTRRAGATRGGRAPRPAAARARPGRA